MYFHEIIKKIYKKEIQFCSIHLNILMKQTFLKIHKDVNKRLFDKRILKIYELGRSSINTITTSIPERRTNRTISRRADLPVSNNLSR